MIDFFQHLIHLVETMAHDAMIDEFMRRIDSIPGVHVG
jgi:hypothetical protein